MVWDVGGLDSVKLRVICLKVWGVRMIFGG